MPAAPEAKLAVKVATSSFSTGSVTSLELGRGVADGRAQGQGALADDGGQGRSRTDRMGPQTNSARSIRWLPMSDRAPDPGRPVAPAHGGVRVDPVVAPVVAVEVQGPAERAGGDLVPDGVDGGGAAEHEADAGLAVRRLGRRDHGLGVLDGGGHRLLAEDVLARGQQALDDRAVERVGHDPLTTSMSSAAATASQPPSARSKPKRRAVSVAKVGLTSAIATSRTSGRPSS